MPSAIGVLGFGAPRLGTAPYAEMADPINNAVDRWLERQQGVLLGRLPFYRWRLRRRARRVLALEADMAALSDARLRAAAERLRPALLADPEAPEAVARAFALVREASARCLGKRHYPVQIMGALALYDGRMVEMATGEGKTLTATPAALVAALAGAPVHVVTVNDYLAARDAEENRPLFDFFGLTCGVIDSDLDPDDRREAYRCDITYTSNSNLAFDYLRDRIALKSRRGLARLRSTQLIAGAGAGAGRLMLRGLAFAIVDEADSVFIDEARTPLILSGGGDDPEAGAMYATALRLARALTEGRDFTIDHKNRQITLEDRGKARLDALAEDEVGIWAITKAREELVSQGLSALRLFELGKDYIIEDGEIQIVDEYTGRSMPDRTWQGGLHQLIEAKEGVEITGRKETLARITYQRFFRRYLRLSGMTGTGMEVAGEFKDTYGLLSVRVPRHKPLRRRHLRTRFLKDETAKWAALAETVARINATGQPILIGTRSVDASEQASKALAAHGLAHSVLNARQDANEAEIVAGAGQPGAITVATNMAGRGTDISLGQGVGALGGLHVILTEFHESNRIDRQLYGRAGRQGDPGSSEALVALDDELFRRFAPLWLRLARAVPIRPVFLWMLWRAQSRAEREHSLTRREQTKLDHQLEKSLAFTGPPE